jgi:hypothetical protein
VSRPARRPARAVAALAVVLAVAAALAPGASPSRFLRVGLFDDGQVLTGKVDTVFPLLASTRAQVVRITLWWSGPTVSVARTRPATPTDPADPAYDWSTYDRVVRAAAAGGLEPLLSILGTPSWANGGRRWNVAPTDAADLQRFATAAATRYSGTYRLADGTTLPRVRLWVAWNEPNNPVFLAPQFARTPSGRWQVRSARDYARICNAIVVGVHAVPPRGKVACGVTAPRGNDDPRSTRPSTSPLAFARALAAAGAVGFEAYAHHPYYGAPVETPTTHPARGSRGKPVTAVTLANLGVLEREVTRLFGPKRIWVTEYGYQTNPPDSVFGVSWLKQASYLQQAVRIARADPRVDLFLWFLLVDDTSPGGWQSGLVTAGGTRKPSFAAFQRAAVR